jgi:DNA-binding PadR family transcriptional regulator
MRWTDVRDAITLRTGAAVGDKPVTRALQALQRMGLVERIDRDDGNHLYALTPQGASQARWATDIFDRLDHHDQPDAEPQTTTEADVSIPWNRRESFQ